MINILRKYPKGIYNDINSKNKLIKQIMDMIFEFVEQVVD